MTTEETPRSKGDLLKSILETDQTEDAGFVSSSVPNSGRSSRMGDYSSQSGDRSTTPSSSSPNAQETSRRKESTKSDSDPGGRRESGPREGTMHFKHGINYTPLVRRSPKTPRKIAEPKKTKRTKGVDPLLYKYAELHEMLSDEGTRQGNILNPQLTRRAQQLMLEYKLAQSGHLPVSWLNARGVCLPNISAKKRGKSRGTSMLQAPRQALKYLDEDDNGGTSIQ